MSISVARSSFSDNKGRIYPKLQDCYALFSYAVLAVKSKGGWGVEGNVFVNGYGLSNSGP